MPVRMGVQSAIRSKLAASVSVHVNASALPLAWHPDAAPLMQVVLYNYPRHCGNTVGPEAFRELRARFPALQVRLHACVQNHGRQVCFLMR